MSNLNPCSCGHTPMIEDKKVSTGTGYRVKCTCGMMTGYFATKGLAAKLWNNRNAPEPHTSHVNPIDNPYKRYKYIWEEFIEAVDAGEKDLPHGMEGTVPLNFLRKTIKFLEEKYK